jgi:hypothetical protein
VNLEQVIANVRHNLRGLHQTQQVRRSRRFRLHVVPFYKEGEPAEHDIAVAFKTVVQPLLHAALESWIDVEALRRMATSPKDRLEESYVANWKSDGHDVVGWLDRYVADGDESSGNVAIAESRNDERFWIWLMSGGSPWPPVLIIDHAASVWAEVLPACMDPYRMGGGESVSQRESALRFAKRRTARSRRAAVVLLPFTIEIRGTAASCEALWVSASERARVTERLWSYSS